MDWKSTAVISGAGILATWFFSMPVVNSPAATPTRSAPAASAPQGGSPSIDIEREATRLQERTHAESHYSDPTRNPFSFGQRRALARPARPVGTSAAVPVPAVARPPAAPRITLDGIATDMVGDQPQRTAMLGGDAGVTLVREGEQVMGYRVARISSDAVELVKESDGSVIRLALR